MAGPIEGFASGLPLWEGSGICSIETRAPVELTPSSVIAGKDSADLLLKRRLRDVQVSEAVR